MRDEQPLPMAIFCGAEHHVTGDLCRRIACDGNHSADGDDVWDPA